MDELRLCFRCEYRARFLETGEGPRYECKSKADGVWSCYAYLPVSPYTTKPLDKKDKRPRHGPVMLSSREVIHEISDVNYKVVKKRNGEATVFAIPQGAKNEKTHRKT